MTASDGLEISLLSFSPNDDRCVQKEKKSPGKVKKAQFFSPNLSTWAIQCQAEKGKYLFYNERNDNIVPSAFDRFSGYSNNRSAWKRWCVRNRYHFLLWEKRSPVWVRRDMEIGNIQHSLFSITVDMASEKNPDFRFSHYQNLTHYRTGFS